MRSFASAVRLTRSTPYVVAEFTAMGGICTVQVLGSDDADGWIGLAFEETRRIEAKFSRYRADSVVSRINAQAGGDWVACDAETLHLIDYAHTLYESSDGLFDATSGILRRAWNFRPPAHATSTIPTQTELDALLPLVGWAMVERSEHAVRLARLGMELDFGGIGKEYAVDRVAHLLQSAGARCGVVNFAGDIRVLGPKPDGSAWVLGVQHPRHADVCIAQLPVHTGALASSGDYERFIQVGAKRYCHILNPKTGWPAQYWQSVSVLAPLASAAGACCTIAMLKEADALPFLEASGLAYLAVDGQGRIFHKDMIS